MRLLAVVLFLFASEAKLQEGDVHSFRLVRGEGEIIEEIVSKEKHKDINKVIHKNIQNMLQKYHS